ncbi:unnamed protein product [Trypanosoma congolense IL3000]|uniref:WGS project CAEQ00000000 data, annotated contig 1853 n=1 Tax=Trypanosoma congolense (strain IL3000) TaxID=1068625 RepID=F9W9E3_TRYCI|nr:unnamed protein product [Trypanosoma congolense IL3000]
MRVMYFIILLFIFVWQIQRGFLVCCYKAAQHLEKKNYFSLWVNGVGVSAVKFERIWHELGVQHLIIFFPLPFNFCFGLRHIYRGFFFLSLLLLRFCTNFCYLAAAPFRSPPRTDCSFLQQRPIHSGSLTLLPIFFSSALFGGCDVTFQNGLLFFFFVFVLSLPLLLFSFRSFSRRGVCCQFCRCVISSLPIFQRHPATLLGHCPHATHTQTFPNNSPFVIFPCDLLFLFFFIVWHLP